MRRRTRLRRAVKWSGTVLCALLLVVLLVLRIASYAYSSPIYGDPQRRAVQFVYHRGCVCCRLIHNMQPAMCRKVQEDSGWIPDFRPWIWWGRCYVQAKSPTHEETTLGLPLWIPFLAALLPTAYLWHKDRRIPPGHCERCGYDLTGNVSGVCPECGTRTGGG